MDNSAHIIQKIKLLVVYTFSISTWSLLLLNAQQALHFNTLRIVLPHFYIRGSSSATSVHHIIFICSPVLFTSQQANTAKYIKQNYRYLMKRSSLDQLEQNHVFFLTLFTARIKCTLTIACT